MIVMERQREEIPVNIERLRDQWRTEGLYPEEPYEPRYKSLGRDRPADALDEDAPIDVAAVLAHEPHRPARRRAASDETIESLREEIRQIRETHTRELQEIKEAYLLELRSVKGLALDIASLVCELVDEVRGKKEKGFWSRFRRRWKES